MLRIVRLDSDAGGSISTLKLEGKLVGPWVGELRRAFEEVQVPPSRLALNLAAVTFIDSAGLQLLGDLLHRGATVYGCRGFIAELLSLNQH
jgi:anti-anti-sigma regulatory factor